MIAILLTLFAGIAELAAQDVLRYRFSPGERVVYERRIDITSLDGSAPPRRVTEQLSYWVLDSQGDDSELLFEIIPVESDGAAGASRGVTLWVDRWGRVRWPDVSLRRWSEIEPALDLLISLPSATLRPDTWQTAPDPVGRALRCSRHGSDPENARRVYIEFNEDDPTGVNLAARRNRSGRITFDTLQGRALSVESIEEDRLAGLRRLSVLRLFRTYEETPDWRRARLGEIARYADLLNLEDRLTDEAGLGGTSAAPLVQRLENAWTSLAADWARLGDSPLRRLTETRERSVSDFATRITRRSKLARGWVNTRAPDWELTTPDGQPVRSESFSDRPQVEVFWSAASLESLRTITAAGSVAAGSAHVLCLNVDEDSARAREAALACGNAPHLLLGARGVIEAGWLDLPVIRVLDAKRRVVAVYFGWRPNLAETLSRQIPEAVGGKP